MMQEGRQYSIYHGLIMSFGGQLVKTQVPNLGTEITKSREQLWASIEQVQTPVWEAQPMS